MDGVHEQGGWIAPLGCLSAGPVLRDLTAMPTHRDPAAFPGALLIESCDIPADLTIAEWRRLRSADTRPPRRRLRFALHMRGTREAAPVTV
jgi:hypothetical protein